MPASKADATRQNRSFYCGRDELSTGEINDLPSVCGTIGSENLAAAFYSTAISNVRFRPIADIRDEVTGTRVITLPMPI